MGPYTFRRKQRLSRRRDFERVVRTACSVADRQLVVYVADNDLARTRLGISVGKRIGPAVKRNRVKRLIRESFRLLQHDLPAGLDVLVVAKPTDHPSLEAYRCSLLDLVRRGSRKLRRGRA